MPHFRGDPSAVKRVLLTYPRRVWESNLSRRSVPSDRTMLGPFKSKAQPRPALDRIKAWTRARFSLSDDAPVFVSQITCTVPGCPPLETVVAFWTEGERRHHFKVFKPVVEVVEDDLPPSWMKNSLVDSDLAGCECC